MRKFLLFIGPPLAAAFGFQMAGADNSVVAAVGLILLLIGYVESRLLVAINENDQKVQDQISRLHGRINELKHETESALDQIRSLKHSS